MLNGVGFPMRQMCGFGADDGGMAPSVPPPPDPGTPFMSTPFEYDPELTEHLLEETGKLLQDSRRLLDDLDDRLDERS